MDLGISAKIAPILADVRNFMEQEIAPLEHEYLSEIAVGDRWQFTAHFVFHRNTHEQCPPNQPISRTGK